MSVFEHFDYEKMAAESEQRLAMLEAGLEKVRDLPAQPWKARMERIAKIKLLEEQIYEEKLDLNVFLERAKERSQS